MRPVALGVVLAALLVGGACGGRKLPIANGQPVGTSPEPKHDAGPKTLQPSLVATLTDKAVGPVLAMNDGHGLVAYLATTGTVRTLVAVPTDAAGTTTGDARVVATVPVDSSSLVLERATDGHGWVAAWATLTDKGEAVYAVGVKLDGNPRGQPVEIGRTTDDVVWIDLVPTSKGTVCVWAEETQKGDANLLAAALDGEGRPRGVASYAVRGASGWQVAPAKNGVAVAVLRAAPPKGEPTLDWLRLGEDAHAIGEAARLITGHGVGRDLDVAPSADGGFVAVWTDRARPESQVVVATVDDAGRVQGPRDLSPTSGASVLTAIASGSAGVVIGWEDPRRRKKVSRQVHLDVVGRGGAVTRGAVLEIQGGAQPELRATPAGFAVLGWARLCAEGADAMACAQAAFAPSLVVLDAHGAVARAEPVRLPTETPALTWNLACKDGCVALAATAGSPTRVFTTPLGRGPATHRAVAIPPPPADAPDVIALGTLSNGTLVSDVAVARVAGKDAFLVASLTANDDTTGSLGVRTLAVDGTAGPVTILAKQALPVGGVAIATTANADDGAAVAWVARDAGDPQVHVARLDKVGKRTGEVQLTNVKGDASDVAIGWANGGWLVAWVDARDGNGEVYATRLGADLKKGREERITNATGDATDLAMVVAGERAWLAWADPRESPKDGFADIWATAIGASDAKRAEGETRVLPSVAHSRSPAIARSGDGAVVAWIEEAPAGADPRATQSYGAMLAVLDARGKPKGDAMHLRTGAEGFPTGVWLDPSTTDRTRGVLVRADGDDLHLDGFEAGAGTSVAWPIMMLDGPASLDVPLAFAGDALLFGDDGPESIDRRLRRVLLRWKR
jgi:hypothetical protein